jgi:hypothetical protein
MQEIGVWTTAEGTVAATLDYEDGVDEFGLPKWASGALQGAAAGATTGLAAGPYGALIGGVAGAAIGGITAATAKPPPKSDAPKPGAAKSAPAGGSSNAAVIQALQQFAAAVPSLIQIVAGASGGKRAEGAGADTESAFATESAAADEWAWVESAREWTVP